MNIKKKHTCMVKKTARSKTKLNSNLGVGKSWAQILVLHFRIAMPQTPCKELGFRDPGVSTGLQGETCPARAQGFSTRGFCFFPPRKC